MKRTNNIFSSLTHVISLCSSYDVETECIMWETDKPSKGNSPFVFLFWKGPCGPPSYIVYGRRPALPVSSCYIA